MLVMCFNAFVHSSTAPISDSQELRAVYDCRLDIQSTGPPNHMMYPAIDLDLKRSIFSDGSAGFGTD